MALAATITRRAEATGRGAKAAQEAIDQHRQALSNLGDRLADTERELTELGGAQSAYFDWCHQHALVVTQGQAAAQVLQERETQLLVNLAAYPPPSTGRAGPAADQSGRAHGLASRRTCHRMLLRRQPGHGCGRRLRPAIRFRAERSGPGSRTPGRRPLGHHRQSGTGAGPGTRRLRPGPARLAARGVSGQPNQPRRRRHPLTLAAVGRVGGSAGSQGGLIPAESAC